MRTAMEKSEVVITGVGAATPLGNDFATFAANLLAGKSVARAITDIQADVQVRLPLLSTWLGHVDPASTYWYLHAVPELLAHAANRLEAQAGSPNTEPVS